MAGFDMKGKFSFSATFSLFSASLGTVNRKISIAIRWLLRLDQRILDQLVDEHLDRNRTALDRKRREWFETRLREQVNNPSG
jgi:hypothetical protein